MDYGFYVSLSAMQTHMARQDVFANNLANVRTPGFKPDIAGVRQRAPQSIEGNHGFDSAHELLDRLGGGVWSAPHRIDFSAGQLEKTDRNLDIALGPDDAFFVIGVPNRDTGAMETRFTRAGNFTIGPNNQLVTMAGGYPVLDRDDQPIQIEPGQMAQFDSTGRLHQGDEVVGQLGIVRITDLEALRKEAQNLFRLDRQAPELRPASDDRRTHPGFLESSGVDPIKALMDVTNAGKAVSSNGTLLRYHDQLMDRAINTLGRLA